MGGVPTLVPLEVVGLSGQIPWLTGQTARAAQPREGRIEYEQPHMKTNNRLMRKQRCRSAVHCYIDSTISLLS